ncbi:MAG: MBL fold metallo-hydrolase [Clostridia bacterium]|nr:MBL fold metallo-hydrolase [Clostridia bacterium]
MDNEKITIKYLGHAFFKVQVNDKIVTFDPVDPKTGYTFDEKIDTNLSCISHNHYDHSYTDALNIIPRDDFNESNVRVVPSFHDDKVGMLRGTNDINIVDIDGFKVCHLGDLGHELTDDLIEEIGEVDILFIPVGGVYTIDGQSAVKEIDKIKTKIVIPMHYKTDKLTFDLDSEEKFTIIARRRHQVINLYMDEINFTRSELDEINYDEKRIYVLKAK